MISIKQLRYLDAISRFGHFGKAAAHCAVTQPALSMQIQEMGGTSASSSWSGAPKARA
jgi:LysR family hydrogen peroxide-inducible transcriptional activator